MSEEKMDEIISEPEKFGYKCRRDDNLLTAGTTIQIIRPQKLLWE